MSQTLTIGAQRGVTIFGETLTATEGISKTAKFATAIISFLGKVLGSLAEGWHAFSGACKACVELLDVMEIFIRITEWVKGEVKGAWKIAARVCLTVFNALKFISFLEKVKLIDLGPVMEKLSSIPVIGWIVNLPISLIGLASFSFSTVHNSLQLRQDDAALRVVRNKKIALQARQNALNESEPARIAALRKQYSDAVVAIKSDKVILGRARSFNAMTVQSDAIDRWSVRIQPAHRTNASLVDRVKKVDLKICQGLVVRDKTIVALVSDAIKIVLVSLSLIAPFIGGILTMTSIPMTAFSLGVAGLGLYKVFHDKFAKQNIENYQRSIDAIRIAR